MAKEIWKKLMCSNSTARSWSLDWNGWLHANSHSKLLCFGELKWVCIFIYASWYIWKWRCKRIFDPNFRYPYDPGSIILISVSEWNAAQGNCSLRVEKAVITVKWVKPPPGWMKVNVDGARAKNGCIGAGGVLRDSDGNWIRGFTASLGKGSVLEAEVWGLLLGLKMASTCQCSALIIECDSDVAVHLLNKGVDDLHSLYSVIGRCKFLMDKCVRLHMCTESSTLLLIFSPRPDWVKPPPQVVNAALDDLCDTAKFRNVAFAT